MKKKFHLNKQNICGNPQVKKHTLQAVVVTASCGCNFNLYLVFSL